MKRTYTITILSILLTLLLSLPAYAYLYSAPYIINESNGTAYDMLAIMADSPNEWLADNGYMNSSANDTRVETLGGVDRPHMVTDNRTLTSVAVPANAQINLYYTTGNSELDAMDIILGYGGYWTVADNAALEPGDNFTHEWSGYIDLSTVGENITYKDDSYRLFVSGTDNITAAMIDWQSPTSFTDPSSQWATETNAYDENTGTNTNDLNVPATSWSANITFSKGAILADAVRVWADVASETTEQIEVSVNTSGLWSNIYTGTFDDLAWVTYSFGDVLEVNNLNLRLYNPNGGLARHAYIYEVDFREYTANVSASGLASGEVDISVSANTTHMTISTDGTLKDTLAIGTANCFDSSSNWILGSNITPYTDNTSLYVDGTREFYFAPTEMILTTNLPDREPNGGSNNGTITWGSNPSGITAVLSSMVSGSQPTVGGAEEDIPRDILPDIGTSDWFGDGTITKASTLSNPFRPFITAVSSNTQLTEIQVWRLLGIALVLLVVVMTAVGVRGHQGITAIMGGVALGALVGFDHNIFPLWCLVISAGCFIGGVIAERSPSL